MFRWKLMLQNRFGLRRQQPKARRAKQTMKPRLEVLEGRIVPSVSPGNPQPDAPTTPSPESSVATINSFLFSAESHEIQVFYTLEQDVFSAVKTLDQEIFQTVAGLEQKWLSLFGFSFTASNQVPNNSVMQPVNNIGGIAKGSGSGSGSGSSATTTHHNADQPIHSFAAQPGSGAGNGSSPDSSGGSATVYGNVWLDNNGDGSIDHGETGFQGITVDLDSVSGGVAASAITDANGNYSITINASPPPGNNFVIQVVIPNADYATIPGYSQIDANGTSAQFALYAGAPPVQINAGIRSMQVTTTQDDAAAAIHMQITLRDAMDTGNNGLPAPAVTFVPGLSGTISLQAELDPINASYNILGPVANQITVNGNDDTGTVFTVNATTEIDNLVIEGGDGVDGAGIDDNGNLTLNADTGEDCDAGGSGGLSPNGMLAGGQAAGSGGFLYVPAGRIANINGGNYHDNQAMADGGGVLNYGNLTLTGNPIITNNNLSFGGLGAGIYNGKGGTVKITGNAQITTNTDTGGNGGGVYNAGTFTMTGGLISGNKATRTAGIGGSGATGGSGAGVYNSGNMTLSKVAITKNTAGNRGGGIYTNVGTLTLKTVKIGGIVGQKTGNKAPYGGGMYIRGGTVKETSGSVVSNAATPVVAGKITCVGGGLFNSGGSLTIKTNVGVYNNNAQNQGGGMYLALGSTTTFGSAPPTACVIDGNKIGGDVKQTKNGLGVYAQKGTAVKQWNTGNIQNVFDQDDPGGVYKTGN